MIIEKSSFTDYFLFMCDVGSALCDLSITSDEEENRANPSHRTTRKFYDALNNLIHTVVCLLHSIFKGGYIDLANDSDGDMDGFVSNTGGQGNHSNATRPATTAVGGSKRPASTTFDAATTRGHTAGIGGDGNDPPLPPRGGKLHPSGCQGALVPYTDSESSDDDMVRMRRRTYNHYLNTSVFSCSPYFPTCCCHEEYNFNLTNTIYRKSSNASTHHHRMQSLASLCAMSGRRFFAPPPDRLLTV